MKSRLLLIHNWPELARTTAYKVNKIAAKYEVSVREVERFVMSEFRISPRELLAQLRMADALDLLQNTLLSIKEIAGKVGYAQVSCFCRVFKLYHGITPGEARDGNVSVEVGEALNMVLRAESTKCRVEITNVALR